ncbi:MAG: T9SS type A sorting domain-containing protein [Flavipsychrobacter sp.]|nr:T9SS type A sorting domain-containing protein [Flavipsychrobacter sp.]
MRKYILLALWLLPFRVFAQVSFTALTTGTSQNLLGISFADTSTGYACGDDGIVIKTANGGTSWVTLNTGTTQKLWDIKCVPNSNGQKAVAVGDNNTVIKTTDGGSTWTAQSIPFQTGSFVFGVQCLDDLNYYACGGDFATNSGAVLKTADGGMTWTKFPVPNSVFLDKIAIPAGTNGYAVGTNTSFSDGAIQKITGNSSSQIKTTGSIVTNLWCINATSVIAVGLAGQIWKSTDGGSTWTDCSLNTTDLYGIGFIDQQNGFACGGTTTGNIILTTSNGGTTWSQIPYTFNGGLQSVCIIGNRIFIAGDQGRIIRSNVTTRLDELVIQSEFLLYPNPARDKIIVQNSTNKQLLTFRLHDVAGKRILESKLGTGLNEVNTSGCNGHYTYTIFQDGQCVETGKILIGQ